MGGIASIAYSCSEEGETFLVSLQSDEFSIQ